MKWLNKFVALALLALWVPATQHCDLEAAGLIAPHADHQGNSDDCDRSTPCSYEGCHAVESDAYQPSGTLVKVPPPVALVRTYFLCLQIASVVARSEPVTPAVIAEKSLSWVPIRHFVRIAAALPRAPSVLG